MRDAIKADQAVMQKPDEYDYVDNQEQPAPEPSASAKAKADAVKEQVKAMKARRTKKDAPIQEEIPAPTIEDMPADQETGEIFNEPDEQ